MFTKTKEDFQQIKSDLIAGNTVETADILAALDLAIAQADRPADAELQELRIAYAAGMTAFDYERVQEWIRAGYVRPHGWGVKHDFRSGNTGSGIGKCSLSLLCARRSNLKS